MFVNKWPIRRLSSEIIARDDLCICCIYRSYERCSLAFPPSQFTLLVIWTNKLRDYAMERDFMLIFMWDCDYEYE